MYLKILRTWCCGVALALPMFLSAHAAAQSCPVPNSVGVVICTPTMEETVTSPVHLTAAAKGNAQIRAWTVYVDGKGVWSPDLYSESISPQLDMAAGQHRITAKAWDVNGQSYSKTIYITVAGSGRCSTSSIGVHICSPSNNANVGSPVEILAAAKGKAQIRAWIVYVDGKGVWSPDLYSTSISPQLDMSPGRHRITAKAWDVRGNVYSQTIYVNVN